MVSLKGIRKSWILYRALYRWPRSTTESDLMVWLVVEPYPWKIWVGQLGWWNPQYMESHKFHGSSMFQSPPTSAGEYQEIQKVHRKIRMESVGCGWEMWKQSCSLKNTAHVGFHVVPCGMPKFHKKSTAPPAQLPTTMDGEPSPPHPLVSKTSSKNSFIVPSGESGYLT